jgi:glucose/mannose-6-phosphate isomerase
MEKLITAFPQNILEALAIAENQTFKQPSNTIQNIVICGMGGSGIGGKIVAQWIQDEAQVPVTILNDYTLPKFVNKHSLIIGSSYSGNTEETLAAIYDAHNIGAHIIGICSGGELKSFCEKENYDHIIVPGGNPPRTAIAFSIVQLINIFVQLGIIGENNLEEIKLGQQLILKESTPIHTIAKELASFLVGKVGVFYSGPNYEGVAIRARQQFNENSKLLCWHHVIPEMNHNELVGWGGGDDRFAVVFFNTKDLIPRNQKRYDISKDIISKRGAKIMEVDAIGESQIQKSLYLINLVDWASFYLAEIKDADIMDIKVIDFLKSELANFK